MKIGKNWRGALSTQPWGVIIQVDCRPSSVNKAVKDRPVIPSLLKPCNSDKFFGPPKWTLVQLYFGFCWRWWWFPALYPHSRRITDVSSQAHPLKRYWAFKLRASCLHSKCTSTLSHLLQMSLLELVELFQLLIFDIKRILKKKKQAGIWKI